MDGVLIFAEVCVVFRLMWNSDSYWVGDISHKDMACLHDVYQTLEDATTNSITYTLQYLWHVLTSHFNVVGPCYTSSGALESKFIPGILMETIKIFQNKHQCLST